MRLHSPHSTAHIPQRRRRRRRQTQRSTLPPARPASSSALKDPGSAFFHRLPLKLIRASPAMSSGRSTPFSGRAPALANAFVSISGLIGAGKSTLAVALGKELNLPVHFEPVAENVYLQDFYRDMKTCVAAATFARRLPDHCLGTRSPCRFTCSTSASASSSRSCGRAAAPCR